MEVVHDTIRANLLIYFLKFSYLDPFVNVK